MYIPPALYFDKTMNEDVKQSGLLPLLVDDKGAASLLSVSRAHFLKLRASGRIDVPRISLGRRKLYSVIALRRWVAQGCKPCRRD